MFAVPSGLVGVGAGVVRGIRASLDLVNLAHAEHNNTSCFITHTGITSNYECLREEREKNEAEILTNVHNWLE
jgi:hypothetical protein